MAYCPKEAVIPKELPRQRQRPRDPGHPGSAKARARSDRPLMQALPGAEGYFWSRPAGEDREGCGERAGRRGAASLGHTGIGRSRVVKYPAHERWSEPLQARWRMLWRRVAGIFHTRHRSAARLVARRCGRHRQCARLRASPVDEPRAVALQGRCLASAHASCLAPHSFVWMLLRKSALLFVCLSLERSNDIASCGERVASARRRRWSLLTSSLE